MILATVEAGFFYPSGNPELVIFVLEFAGVPARGETMEKEPVSVVLGRGNAGTLSTLFEL